VDEVADDWSPDYRRTQPNRILQLVEEFPTLNDVKDQKKQRAFRGRRLKEVLRSTLCEDLVPLRMCLGWAYDEGLIAGLPEVPLPDKSKKGVRAHDRSRVDLTDAKTEALLTALPVKTRSGHPARDVFTVVWDTSLRHGGIFRAEAGRHFKPPDRVLYRTADIDKCGVEEPLLLTERAYQALLRNAPDIGPIFKPWDYRKTLRKAAAAIGLPPADVKSLDMRDFRHAALTDGARKSGHLTGLSHMAGHTDQRTTSRYIHPTTEDQREVLNKRFPSNGTPNGTPSAEPEEDAC
jgi:integrase